MGFEKFTETGKSFAPKMSIRKNGSIGFNQGSISKYKLAEYNFVIFFYDKVRNIIGVKPTNIEEPGACKLRVRDYNGSMGGSVGGKVFLDYYNIEYGTKTQRIDIDWDAEENMIVAQL